jgi:hypothetical protein
MLVRTTLETGAARVQKRRKSRKSAVKAATNAPDIRELQIPDSVIDQILQAMEVPETSWSDAAWKVFSAVESCVESFIDGRLGANNNRYKVIASTCRRLRRELSKLNIAFMVAPEFQGAGLGTALQTCLQEYAISRNVRGFVFEILPRNTSMLRLAARTQGTVTTSRDEEVVHVTALFLDTSSSLSLAPNSQDPPARQLAA